MNKNKRKILLAAINAKYIHSNLAVYSLRAYAGQYSRNIKICEYTINNQVEDIIDGIYREKPQVVAFSCYIWNIEYVKKLMHELHKLLPQCHIWLGGPEVSYNTDYYMDSFDYIKGIMVGEGEETFKELAQLYETVENMNDIDKQLDKLAGIVTHKRHSPLNREPVDMSAIPFVYPAYNNQENNTGNSGSLDTNLDSFKNRIIYYESSRGCPYSCSYCLSCIDKKLRFRDMALVEQELRFFLDKRVPQVKFIDRTFNCNSERCAHIWRYISDNDNGVTNFHFEIASDLLRDEHIDILKSMRPGLVQLEIGVQSTNEETLRAIRRRMDIGRLREVVKKLCENKNIHIHLDLIAGLPYADIISFKKSFNDVYNMRPDELQLGFLKVLYGSYMYEDAKKYGIEYKSFPPYEVLYTDWLTYDDILKLKRIEEVLEIYYGSGQFVYSVRYLQEHFETPYDFYDELGRFYDVSYERGKKHSRIDRYDILLEFATYINANECNVTCIDVRLLGELMTLDIYLRENMKSRPAFAASKESYRQQIKELAREKGIGKSDHIEVFTPEVIQYARDIFSDIKDEISCELMFVRFDYTHRNPVNYNATVSIIGK